MHPLRKLFQYATRFRRDFILGSTYSVLNKFFDILPEVLIGVAVDIVVNGEKSFLAREILSNWGIVDTWHQLLLLGGLNVVIWGFESLTEYLHHIKWRNLAQSLQHDMRLDAYDHVQKLTLSYFENRKTGNLMSILNDDINQMERFLNTGANEIIQVVCSSLMVSAVFFVLQPTIAIVALLPVPLILFGAFWFQKKLAPRYAAVREAAGNVNAKLNNNLLGLATIKSFAAETFELNRVKTASEQYRQKNAEAIKINSAITPVIRMAILMGFTTTLVYGGYLTIHGELAVGAFSVLVYLTQRLLWPLTRLADVADMYQRSMASIDRALSLLETPISIPYEGTHIDKATVKGALRFEQVAFSYDESARVLSQLNLNIPAGQTVGFVGATGAGKSSLIKLLLRFYQPSEGMITSDGVDIQKLNLQDWRRCIGYVSQDTFLTDGTIAENIAYGISASEAQILEAAAQANVLDFVAALPHGIHTPIGERGQKLSGGQRQRIALARAILKDPPILLLDEATSAVDNETEAAIQQSLNVVAKGRTSLVVAHRLSTVRHADVIYVMDQGQIVESGTHDALIMKGGQYAELWRLQTGGGL